MIEHFSPEGRAAVEEIKAFICEAMSLDALNERALLLAGLPADDLEEGIAKFCRELAECFARERLQERFQLGFVIAAGDIISAVGGKRLFDQGAGMTQVHKPSVRWVAANNPKQK